MTTRAWLACVGLALMFVPPPAIAAEPPPWAFFVNPPNFQREKDDGAQRHVPDSTLALTLSQVRNLFYAPDWHPDDHPPLPQVVATGRKPDVFACGFCHRADGPGGPENSNLRGMPVDYQLRQMAEFANETRKTSQPGGLASSLMARISRSITPEESKAALEYFAALPFRKMVDLVETSVVPKTEVNEAHLVAIPNGGTEAIGKRIIEVANDNSRFILRDARVRFTAYVPSGSVAKGRALATSGGNGRTVVCTICHGPELKGAGMIPPIAGRSPSYLFRQLWDFKAGTRTGVNSVLMKPTVQNLALDDMIALAAYVTSLKP